MSSLPHAASYGVAHAQELSSPSSAQSVPSEALRLTPPAPRVEMGLWPGFVALVPGALAHGLGHAVGGDTETAWNLALLQGSGAALMLIGAGMTGPTGASRKLIGVAYPAGLAGFGLFTGSWIADVYGSFTGGRTATGSPFVPTTWLRAGMMFVHDPQFAYTTFAQASADMRISHWRVAPSFFRALDDSNMRVASQFGFRIDGPRPHHIAEDASYIDLVQGIAWHDYASDGFDVLTLSVEAQSRYDLDNLSTTLRGSFAEMSLGLGLEFYEYDALDFTYGEDSNELLLMRIGYGMYFGQGGLAEVQVFYDHRHDDLAGSLTVSEANAGVFGHLGAQGFWWFTNAWGLSFQGKVGSALIAQTSLMMRMDTASSGLME